MLKQIARAIAIPLALAGLLMACQPVAVETPDYAATIVPKNPTVDSDDGFTYVAITAKTKWNVVLQYPEEGPADWATMDPDSGEGDKADVRLRFSQNEGEESRTVTLVLVSLEEEVAKATVTQKGQKVTPPTPGGEDGKTTTGWLELPETRDGDGCVFLAHDMDGEKYISSTKSGVRNWSCYWCYDEHVSYWVAYPLNRALIGSGSRTDAWGVFDPLLPSSMQPNMGSTYGGGWTRGHQIPSADRYNNKANRSTFYPTNMTPQDYDFNAKIWASLEGQMRSYSYNSDTLYVVTGCVLEGSTRVSGYNSGFAVKVPAAYFKAALQKSTSTSVGHNGWRAAAWYLPHDAPANGSFNSYVMTVDALEAKLGYDLFVNLPTAVGQKLADEIEADCNWAK